MNIWITIPVFNEERRLERGVEQLRSFLEENGLVYRIDIANNGSTDKTALIALDLSKKYKNVSVTNVSKKGVGLSLQDSWAKSDLEIIGYMDVDLATNLKHILEVSTILQNDSSVDIINGSRLMKGSSVLGRSVVRGILSRIFNVLLRKVLGVRFTDGMCGFKFLRQNVYQDIKTSGLNRQDWFFNAELLIRGSWLGYKIYEIPVVWQDSDESKVKILSLSYRYIMAIFRLCFERRARDRKG